MQIWILVLVDNADQIFVSYYKQLQGRKDSNNMMNVIIHDQILISGSKLIMQWFTYVGF